MSKSAVVSFVRRRLQISLRTFMVATTLIGAVLGWWMLSAERQHSAVRQLRSAGGQVGYRHFGNGDDSRLMKPPAWLVDWVGPDYFDTVRSASLIDDQFNGAALGSVGSLHALEQLIVRGSGKGFDESDGYRWPFNIGDNIDDEGTNKLKDLANLTDLTICESRVDDEGMSCLSNMKKLQRLNLLGCLVGDGTLAYLSGYSKPGGTLEELNLAYTQVTDRGLACLTGISSLRHLNLRHTHVSEIGLSQMRPAKLDYLELGYTDVKSLEFLQSKQPGDWSILRDLGVKATPLDDAGLETMPLLPNLQYLWLANTKITGKSLAKIASCAPNIGLLELDGTEVDDDGVEQLVNLQRLGQIRLERTKVTDRVFESLRKMRLGIVMLAGNPDISSAALQQFQADCPNASVNSLMLKRIPVKAKPSNQ
jgi:hypothetical protein